MGEWITQNTPANAKIAAVEIGAVGWYTDRYVIDIVGLTSPANARYTAKKDFSSWLLSKPDLIVVHPGVAFTWEAVALTSPEYEMLSVHFGPLHLLRRK